MIRRIPLAMVFKFALIASTACISIKANAQQTVPDQQSQRQETPAATSDKNEQTARGRLADAKAGLKLSTEQEKLWAPVEDALRNLQERSRVARSSSGEGQPNDQIARLRRLGELATQRGDALKQLADAVQPLWDTLTDEQKRELPPIVAVTGEQNDQDRTMHRGRNADNNRSAGRGRDADDDRGTATARRGDGRRDDDRQSGQDSRRGSGDGQRYGRDDDQRRDRVDGYSRRGSRDDDRHSSQDSRRGSGDSQRYGRDDDQRRDRVDSCPHHGSHDDNRS